MLKTLSHLCLFGIALACFYSCTEKTTIEFPEGIQHVVVIGVDGLSPDGIKKATAPVLDSLIKQGSVSWKVRTVLPSASSQNWASMIMGAGPEIHGITNNSWKIHDHTLPPVISEKDGRFPTIFSILRQQRPDAEMGVVHHWRDFGRLYQKDALNYDKFFSTEDSATAAFAEYIIASKPTLAFLHLDHVDHAGHHDGHGSEIYYASVEKTDSLIGNIMSSINAAGIADNTLVIITSDHGGKDKGHGGATLEEAEIALILSGKNIRKGFEPKQQVYMYDLASTIAFSLGLKQPYAWTGRPTKAAFEGFNEPDNLYFGAEKND